MQGSRRVKTQDLLFGTCLRTQVRQQGLGVSDGIADLCALRGIRVTQVTLLVFTIAGALSGLAGILYASRWGFVNPSNTGFGFEFQVIAAVVIGGTSLMGGRGSVISTFFGVLIISVLAAGLAQIGASEPTKRIITGAVIVIAVVLDTYRSRRAGRRN